MSPPEPGAAVRALVADARDLLDRVHAAQQAEQTARAAVEQAFTELRAEMVRRELSTIPLARLRDTTDGRLRFGPLDRSGYRTVLDVLNAGPRRLETVPGVGPLTATQVYAAARQVAAAVDDGFKVRIDLDPDNPRSTRLVQAIRGYELVQGAAAALQQTGQRLERDLAAALADATPATGRIRWLFTGSGRKATAGRAVDYLDQWMTHAAATGLAAQFTTITRIAEHGAPHPDAVWKDFAHRAAEYYGVLGEIVDLNLDVAATEGFLPAEIVERVNQQTLDDSLRRVSLRGYQSFGARFALVQRRVIIGDEMGLGKTIEAIAAIAHLKALGSTHFLVVCPASVLINWTREIRSRSTLMAYRIHGPSRHAEARAWASRGDVAVATYESLRDLELPHDLPLGLLVVDEAHYVKNPAALRSTRVASWTTRADRVLFLTGTPMENKVEEFRNLVGYLQPQLAAAVHGRHGIAGPAAFRRAVAPVYLRRNQEDVLTELPDLVQVDEWEEFSRADFAAYRSAVMAGNFMAMRRAAFASGDPRSSAKLQRLVEIADEAGDNGHKVVVFSYFRDVLDTVHTTLGARAFGPLTGGLPPAQRQALVDAFARADGHGVLVSQIQAGGVGLNMQAASVVILCEPQVKPTMESQAVARAHRMGQVRKVQMHRLLVADSVDQRMLEILDTKTRLFDDYARRSDIAEGSPDAVDISEIELARRVVQAEQERLALGQMTATTTDGPPDLQADSGT